MMKNWIQVLCAIFASSGVWSCIHAFIQSRTSKKDAMTAMLIGLGHDRIVYLGTQYIKKGYISKDEYENLHDYLYLPYIKLGGNGTAKKVMAEVEKLPIKN